MTVKHGGKLWRPLSGFHPRIWYLLETIFCRSWTLIIWPDSVPTKLLDHPKHKHRRGGGLKQINTCRKVPLQVNFLDDDICLVFSPWVACFFKPYIVYSHMGDKYIGIHTNHRLNRQLNLQSLLGLHVHSCTHWMSSRNPPPPRFWAHIRGRYWSAKKDDISLWPPVTRASLNPNSSIGQPYCRKKQKQVQNILLGVLKNVFPGIFEKIILCILWWWPNECAIAYVVRE